MSRREVRTCIPVHKDGAFAYHIYLEESFEKLSKFINELNVSHRKLCIITDTNVNDLYLRTICEKLEPVCAKMSTFVFPAGERHKTLDTVRDLYEHLILEHFERGDMLAALGGGVVGDLTGYAAATYLRGIDFIQIPTTLLSQVDSSIGGKTGVDFDSYKNMIGAFHQPKMVYMNISTLKSLADEQFFCGMGEILKHGLIKDAGYYEWTIQHLSEIHDRNISVLKKMISMSCEIKREVVEKDPTEKGERALLNFGHTIGHAIEKRMDFKLLHGQCVALGYLAAAYISWKRELLSTEEFFEIRDMNVGFELPISLQDLDAEQILETTRSDKKMEQDKIKFILLDGIGHAFVDKTVSDNEIRDAVNYLTAKASPPLPGEAKAVSGVRKDYEDE